MVSVSAITSMSLQRMVRRTGARRLVWTDFAALLILIVQILCNSVYFLDIYQNEKRMYLADTL